MIKFVHYILKKYSVLLMCDYISFKYIKAESLKIVVLSLLLILLSHELQAQWIREGISRAFSRSTGVVTTHDAVYSMGEFTCVIGFDTDTLTNNSCGEVAAPPLPFTQVDAFIAKHDKDGNLIWRKHYKGSSDNSLTLYDIKVDDSGKLYVLGAYRGLLQVGVPPLSNPDQTEEFFLMSIFPDGNLDWVVTRQTTGTTRMIFTRIALSSSAVYISGTLQGDFVVAGNLISATNPQAAITSYSRSGNFRWLKNFDEAIPTGTSNGQALAFFDNRLWMYSTVQDSINVITKGYKPPAGASAGGLLTVFKETGALDTLYGTSVTTITDLAADTVRNKLYLAGSLQGNSTIETLTLYNNPNKIAFISSHNSDLSLAWIAPLTGTNVTAFSDARLSVESASGDVYLSGAAEASSISFAGMTKTIASKPDGFVIKCNQAGVPQWLQQLGGAGEDKCTGVSAIDSDHVYASGYFTNYLRVADEEAYSPAVNNSFVAQLDKCPTWSADMITANSLTRCAGDSALFQVAPLNGAVYAWYVDDQLLAGNTSSRYFKEAGLYKVKVMYQGCSKFTTATRLIISQLPPSDVFTADQLNQCAGNAVSFTGPPGPYQYQWLRGGAVIASETKLAYKATVDGDYQLRITDANGCQSISDPMPARFFAYASSTLQVSSTSLILCRGDELTLQADQALPGLTYTWYKNNILIDLAVNSSYTVKEAGTYSAIITNSIGCETQSEAKAIVLREKPQLSFDPSKYPAEVCDQASVRLVTSNILGQRYQWQQNNIDIPGATLNSLEVTRTGNYRVIASNSDCSVVSGMYTLTVNPLPAAILTDNTPRTICSQDNFSLETNQQPGYRYQWLKDSRVLPGATDPAWLIRETGNYVVSVTDQKGCTAQSAPVFITVNPLPVATAFSLDPVTFCAGGTTRLEATASPSFQYQWFRDGAPIPGETSPTYTAAVSGNYSVSVTNTNTRCSITPATIQVDALPLPSATLVSATGSFCDRDSVLLQAGDSPLYRYTWYHDQAPVAVTGDSFYAKLPGTYSVTASNGICSSASPGVTLRVLDNPVPILTRDEDFLSTASTGAIQWFRDGMPLIDQIFQSIRADQNGAYTVVVTRTNGCRATSLPLAICLPIPYLQLEEDRLTASDLQGMAYTWKYEGVPIGGATQPALQVEKSGSYSLLITDAQGCTMETDPKEVCVPFAFITQDAVSGVLYAHPAPAKSYQWFMNGVALQQEDLQVYIPNGPGEFIVEVTSFDGCVSRSKSLTIEVVTSIEKPSADDIAVFPNPALEYVFVSRSDQAMITISVLDTNGKEITRVTSLESLTRLPLTDALPGLYYLVVVRNNQRVVRKLIRR